MKRVSSPDKKNDLERQKQVLELFCSTHGWQFQVIEDLGSGLNYSKRGLQRLIRMITDNQVERKRAYPQRQTIKIWL